MKKHFLRNRVFHLVNELMTSIEDERTAHNELLDCFREARLTKDIILRDKQKNEGHSHRSIEPVSQPQNAFSKRRESIVKSGRRRRQSDVPLLDRIITARRQSFPLNGSILNHVSEKNPETENEVFGVIEEASANEMNNNIYPDNSNVHHLDEKVNISESDKVDNSKLNFVSNKTEDKPLDVKNENTDGKFSQKNIPSNVRQTLHKQLAGKQIANNNNETELGQNACKTKSSVFVLKAEPCNNTENDNTVNDTRENAVSPECENTYKESKLLKTGKPVTENSKDTENSYNAPNFNRNAEFLKLEKTLKDTAQITNDNGVDDRVYEQKTEANISERNPFEVKKSEGQIKSKECHKQNSNKANITTATITEQTKHFRELNYNQKNIHCSNKNCLKLHNDKNLTRESHENSFQTLVSVEVESSPNVSDSDDESLVQIVGFDDEIRLTNGSNNKNNTYDCDDIPIDSSLPLNAYTSTMEYTSRKQHASVQPKLNSIAEASHESFQTLSHSSETESRSVIEIQSKTDERQNLIGNENSRQQKRGINKRIKAHSDPPDSSPSCFRDKNATEKQRPKTANDDSNKRGHSKGCRHSKKLISIDLLGVYENNIDLQKVDYRELRPRTYNEKYRRSRSKSPKKKRAFEKRKYDMTPLPPKFTSGTPLILQGQISRSNASLKSSSSTGSRSSCSSATPLYKTFTDRSSENRYRSPDRTLWNSLDLNSDRRYVQIKKDDVAYNSGASKRDEDTVKPLPLKDAIRRVRSAKTVPCLRDLIDVSKQGLFLRYTPPPKSINVFAFEGMHILRT